MLCHHDLDPNNTVYRAGVPYAFIDWDIAGTGNSLKGRREHLLAVA